MNKNEDPSVGYLLLIVSVAVNLMVCLQFIRWDRNRVTGGRSIQVLMAVSEIPAGTQITEYHLGFRNIPERYLQQRMVLRSELRQVVGAPTSSAFRAYQTLSRTDLIAPRLAPSAQQQLEQRR